MILTGFSSALPGMHAFWYQEDKGLLVSIHCMRQGMRESTHIIFVDRRDDGRRRKLRNNQKHWQDQVLAGLLPSDGWSPIHQRQQPRRPSS